MIENSNLGDFIYKLRKEKGYSQTDLANELGVSYKAVSKWETNEAQPKLSRLKDLARVFNISVDELINCRIAENGMEKNQDDKKSLFGIIGTSSKSNKHYEFKSEKRTKKGLPFLHINVGLDENGKVRRAKGIIAVGIIAKGIISLGIVSTGIIAVGAIALGLIAVGSLSLGALIATGAVAIGVGVSVGGIAVGSVAIGGVAIGILSVGGLSIGVAAHTGEFGKAIGIFTKYHIFR